MRLKIDLEIPQWTKWLAGGIAIGLALGMGAWRVYAEVPNTFSPGDKLTAKTMNDNFKALQDAINSARVVTKNGKQYSIGATYCGASIATNGQITNGYAGAKYLCEQVQACANSPSAHMCTSEELSRTRQMGIAVPDGWYSSALYYAYVGGSQIIHGSNDCEGWTNGTSDGGNAFWSARPTASDCSFQAPVLCCD